MKLILVLAAIYSLSSAGTITPSLKLKVQAGGVHDAILELPSIMGQVESSSELASLRGESKVNALVTMLKDLTSAAQASYMRAIEGIEGLEIEQFWAANNIHLKGVNMATLEKLTKLKGDFTLREPVTVSINPVSVEHLNPTQAPQWGVAQIRADVAWGRTQGEGVVVGIIDTGANVDHVALTNNFAGAWLDPHYNMSSPTDTHGHGTHNLGVLVGQSNGIGVAPRARWVACRGLSHQGTGSETELAICSQFMITASPRPHIVSNSWGGGSSQFFDQYIAAWRNAGIIPVFALGGSGPGCGSNGYPGNSPNVIAAGATTTTDSVTSNSARGPSPTGELKPELCAPGQNIVSAGTGSNNYVTMSGTAMACPHVAGSAALVLSANPSYNYAQVLSLLQTTAEPAGDKTCGPDGPEPIPNNVCGYGRVDVGAALGLFH